MTKAASTLEKPWNSMRLLTLTATLALLFLLSACEPADSSFDIDSYRGKWLVINYWAEWCTPCIKEIPALNKLQEDYRGDITVAAVNADGLEAEALQSTSQRFGIRYEVLEKDPADALRLATPAALPTTYIFDPRGEMRAKLVGPQTAETILAHTDLVN